MNTLVYSMLGSSLLFFVVKLQLWLFILSMPPLKSRSCWSESNLIHGSDFTWKMLDTMLLFKRVIQSHNTPTEMGDGVNNVWLSIYMPYPMWDVYINTLSESRHAETKSTETYSHWKSLQLFKPEFPLITLLNLCACQTYSWLRKKERDKSK